METRRGMMQRILKTKGQARFDGICRYCLKKRRKNHACKRRRSVRRGTVKRSQAQEQNSGVFKLRLDVSKPDRGNNRLHNFLVNPSGVIRPPSTQMVPQRSTFGPVGYRPTKWVRPKRAPHLCSTCLEGSHDWCKHGKCQCLCRTNPVPSLE